MEFGKHFIHKIIIHTSEMPKTVLLLFARRLRDISSVRTFIRSHILRFYGFLLLCVWTVECCALCTGNVKRTRIPIYITAADSAVLVYAKLYNVDGIATLTERFSKWHDYKLRPYFPFTKKCPQLKYRLLMNHYGLFMDRCTTRLQPKQFTRYIIYSNIVGNLFATISRYETI